MSSPSRPSLAGWWQCSECHNTNNPALAPARCTTCGALSSLSRIQSQIWDGRLPLEIRLVPSECRTYDQSDPFLVSYPRLSYLPLLLPRLLDYFGQCLIADASEISPWDGYLTYENVPLKWHLPAGLLYDIYALPAQNPDSPQPLPFKLTLHFSTTSSPSPLAGPINLIKPEPVVLHDSYINSVKEADFPSLGDCQTHHVLVNGGYSLLPNQFRNIPLRVYLPSSPDQDPKKAQIKVLQSQVPTSLQHPATQRAPIQGQPQTLGIALHTMLPNLFPSRRTPILAKPILHGAPVPMGAHLEELARWASYADGWLNIAVVMNS